MADFFYGRMTIGGSITTADFAYLLSEAAGEVPIAFEDGYLVLEDDGARYGEFPGIEALARRLDLSYRRFSRGQYEHDPEVVLHVPDKQDAVQAFHARQDGSMVKARHGADWTVEEAQDVELPELELSDSDQSPRAFYESFRSKAPDEREGILRESNEW